MNPGSLPFQSEEQQIKELEAQLRQYRSVEWYDYWTLHRPHGGDFDRYSTDGLEGINKSIRHEWEEKEAAKAQKRREIKSLIKQKERAIQIRKERERQDPTPDVLSASTIPQIPFEIRDQHVFIPGMTRHGKSTQLFHLILDDINNDRGVALLDPLKADLITELLPYIPERRLKDCIYLDTKNPIPLDVMRPTPDPQELVGDIKNLILKEDTTLKRAEPILTRLLYALLSIPGSKFTDIEDVFTLPKRQRWFMDHLEKHDERRFEYFKKIFTTSHFDSVLSRMTDFTENPSLRIILGHPYPQLNLRKAMDERKIILVSLPGKSETNQIYGSLLISRFEQAALSRAADNIPKSARVPFCLYVDEFEEFQTSSFAKILEAAGGLKLYLTVGNQHIFQLTDEIRHSILGNVGTFIIFTLGEGENEFSRAIHPYKPYRIGLIPRYQAVFKVGDDAPQFHWTRPAPHGKELSPALQKRSREIRDRLIQQTRDNYSWDACDRAMMMSMDAQSGTNRTGDNPPCDTSSVAHTEDNEHHEHQDETISPSGRARLPLDGKKNKRP